MVAYRWEDPARMGRFEEAEQALATMAPDKDWNWTEQMDSLGLPAPQTNDRLHRFLASPEVVGAQAAADAAQQAVWARYRSIVATALPDEPSVPQQRARWPRNPPQ